MKTILLIITIALFSCHDKDAEDLERVNALIKSEQGKLYRDSVRIDQEMQFEIAKLRLEKATGKKDTLTKAEWLEKARESFK